MDRLSEIISFLKDCFESFEIMIEGGMFLREAFERFDNLDCCFLLDIPSTLNDNLVILAYDFIARR